MNESPPVSAVSTNNVPEPQVNDEVQRMWHSRHGYLGYQILKKLAKICVGMDLSIPPPTDACESYSITDMKVEKHSSWSIRVISKPSGIL